MEISMTITLDQLSKIFSKTNKERLAKYVDPINLTIKDFNINNPAMFLAQIGVESAELSRFEENLNYSGQRLLEVFPRYFRGLNVEDYAHNPEAIANRVYGGRLGNRPESSGDGWKYRGVGAIQITGKANHAAFAAYLKQDVDAATEYMSTPEGAIYSAGWFWQTHNCNNVSNNIRATTLKINGGENDLSARQALYIKAKAVLL
jgi:putative chitinase